MPIDGVKIFPEVANEVQNTNVRRWKTSSLPKAEGRVLIGLAGIAASMIRHEIFEEMLAGDNIAFWLGLACQALTGRGSLLVDLMASNTGV